MLHTVCMSLYPSIGLVTSVHHHAAAIAYARRDHIDWILHVDTDELMYPGGTSDYSLQQILASYAPEVDNVVFPNYEAMPESDHVDNPFTEVRHAMSWGEQVLLPAVSHQPPFYANN